jgi:hypothetical protein
MCKITLIIVLHVNHKQIVPHVNHCMELIIFYYARNVHIYMDKIVLVVIVIGVVYNVKHRLYSLIEDVDIAINMCHIVLRVMLILLLIQQMELLHVLNAICNISQEPMVNVEDVLSR